MYAQVVTYKCPTDSIFKHLRTTPGRPIDGSVNGVMCPTIVKSVTLGRGNNIQSGPNVEKRPKE